MSTGSIDTSRTRYVGIWAVVIRIVFSNDNLAMMDEAHVLVLCGICGSFYLC